jgi:hypothetical protein
MCLKCAISMTSLGILTPGNIKSKTRMKTTMECEGETWSFIHVRMQIASENRVLRGISGGRKKISK